MQLSNQLNSSGPYGTTVYTGTAYNNCINYLTLYNSGVSNGTWSLTSGTVASWSSSNGNSLQFYPNGTGEYVQFTLTVNTSCGNVAYNIGFYPTQYNYYGYYMLAFRLARLKMFLTSNIQTMLWVVISIPRFPIFVLQEWNGRTVIRYRQ